MGKENNCIEKFRDYDWFGEEISFNINKEGSTHNTAIGGFVSVVLRVAVAIYIWLCFEKLLFHTSDTVYFNLLQDSTIFTNPVSYKE